MRQQHITASDIDQALHAVNKARTQARNLCRDYAEQETGWVKGTRLRHNRQDAIIVEVYGFAGTNPNKWISEPIVLAKIVRKNGTVGKRDKYITIDTDGYWRKRWVVIPGGGAP